MSRSTSRKKHKSSTKRTTQKASPKASGATPVNGKTSTPTPTTNATLEEIEEKTDWSRLFLAIIATLGIVYSLYFGRAILFPIGLAIVLFFLLAPVVRFLSRITTLPESASAAVVVLSLTISLSLAGWVLSGPVSNWFAAGPETFREAEEKLRFIIEPVEKIDDAGDTVTKIAKGGEEDGVLEVTIRQPSLTNYLLSATMNFMGGATITVVLVYLLLAGGHRTLNSVVELMPTVEDKRGFVGMIRDVEQGISSYLLTITGINVALGCLIGTALWLLGLPDPLLLGLMAATLNFIPFVGCFMGASVTFLIGVVYLDTPTEALLGFLIYLSINVVEGNVITPMVLGRSMKLNPAIVFLFIIFWGWVWGVGGILIAVPLLGIMKIVCDNSERLQPIARLLAG
ncbi:MAG: AI-2E family transporter [Planctomycetaceae bacterium]|nr:AI-2E family transporter [Planctomycetaceae bacterium]